MGDSFTLVVSAAGLASFGIQLLQGLNKYAGSALESKDRIRAISADIELAVQVVQALDATIKDRANCLLVNDDAKRLAQEAQNQCWEIFTKNKDKLPKNVATTGSRKRDIFTWPFEEPNLELLRGNLKKIKMNLQLLMNVIILADMKTRRQTEQALLDQQRQQIKELLEQKAAAESRLEVLERDHAQALLAGSWASTSSGHAHVETGPVIGRATVEQRPSSEVSFQDLAAPVQEDPFQILTSNNALVPGCLSISDNRSSSRFHTSPESNTPENFQERVEATPGLSNKGDLSRDNLELESLMAELHNDYTTCLEQIKALQEKLETALGGMFVPGISAPAVNFELATDDRRNLARTVDLSVWETYECLDKRISKTSAHTKIIEQPLSRDKASLFDIVTGRKNHPEAVDHTLVNNDNDKEAPGQLPRSWSMDHTARLMEVEAGVNVPQSRNVEVALLVEDESQDLHGPIPSPDKTHFNVVPVHPPSEFDYDTESSLYSQELEDEEDPTPTPTPTNEITFYKRPFPSEPDTVDVLLCKWTTLYD
ncbi:hypothetical protein KCV07_g5774, partial [Aureobasidium melanogenum]